jgi:hypothetical protein
MNQSLEQVFYMVQADIRVIHLRNNKNRDGSRNFGLFNIHLLDVAATLRRFY